MALTYIQRMTLANDRGFQLRVEMALADVAIDIVKGPAAPADERAFAHAVFRGSVSSLHMAKGVLTNQAVMDAGETAPSVTDAEIKIAVEQVWPFYAAANV